MRRLPYGLRRDWLWWLVVLPGSGVAGWRARRMERKTGRPAGAGWSREEWLEAQQQCSWLFADPDKRGGP